MYPCKFQPREDQLQRGSSFGNFSWQPQCPALFLLEIVSADLMMLPFVLIVIFLGNFTSGDNLLFLHQHNQQYNKCSNICICRRLSHLSCHSICVCVSYVHDIANDHGGQRPWVSLELKLQGVVSHPTWTLRTVISKSTTYS